MSGVGMSGGGESLDTWWTIVSNFLNKMFFSLSFFQDYQNWNRKNQNILNRKCTFQYRRREGAGPPPRALKMLLFLY